MPKIVVLFLIVAASAGRAEDPAERALARLIATDSTLARRLNAADDLAEARATILLLDAWVAGNDNIRRYAPTCFHRIGVSGLGDALTAMNSKDPKRRAAGAVLLGSIGPNARLGVRKLIIGLSDASELVRIESVRALGNIGANAEDAIPGLIGLTMRDKKLTLAALQAMTRVTIDAQLRALSKPPTRRITQMVDVAQSWLRFKERPEGGWGDTMTDALVLLAFVNGGVADVNRLPVRKAMRRMVLEFTESKAPPPLVAALMFMAWRETRNPLYLTAGNLLLEKLNVSSTDGSVTSNLHALALKQAQWAGEAVDARIWKSIPPTAPALLGHVLRPGKGDPESEKGEAERMSAKPLKWERDNERWKPRLLVREAWAINLTDDGKPDKPEVPDKSGKRPARRRTPRERYRDAFYQAVFPKLLKPEPGEPPTVAHWEPPGGNHATAISTTAAITAVLRMYSGQYPPRRLPFPKAAKHKAAVHAINGAVLHPDPLVSAYARSMITLWSASGSGS